MDVNDARLMDASKCRWTTYDSLFFVDRSLFEQAIRLQSGLRMGIITPTLPTSSRVRHDQTQRRQDFHCLSSEEEVKTIHCACPTKTGAKRGPRQGKGLPSSHGREESEAATRPELHHHGA